MSRTLIAAPLPVAPGPAWTAAAAPAPAPSTSVASSGNLFDAEDPYIGQVLNDRFVIESKLGEGGFGAVYKGIQKGTQPRRGYQAATPRDDTRQECG